MAQQQYPEQPYSPDVAERETADEGFSRGWGCHFQPSERYIIDAHTHSRETDRYEVFRLIDGFLERASAWRLSRVVVMDGREENLDEFAALARFDRRFRFMIRMEHDRPDLDLLKRGVDNGAVGLKILNIRIMREAGDHKIWLTEPWQKIFQWLEEHNLPVLWHVTQRMTASPYTGGREKAYWSEGWQRGATFTNEDLLQVFLEVVRRYPGIPFIGAHQLHIGWDRLDELFQQHANLHIDTSIGCVVRFADHMYDQDRQKLRRFFCKWADRILFGTDIAFRTGQPEEYLLQHLLGHIRFIHQLQLPYEQLQAVMWRNAERIMKMDSLAETTRGTMRP